jgi:hypothetical protein
MECDSIDEEVESFVKELRDLPRLDLEKELEVKKWILKMTLEALRDER